MYMANRAPELFPGAVFSVAHCNFRLRGGESDGDEAFVRSWCANRGIECFVESFDTRAYAAAHGVSIEMAARELRYAWFAGLCREKGFEAVAVAHNADDNAETLILNLLRGTGIRGVRGMAGREGVLRPLLGTSRSEIRSWMTEHGCSWRDDSTNAESDCRRNLIRNEIFPLFARINPSFVRTLNADMRRLVLWRLLEDSGINSDEFAALADALKEGRQIAGRRYGPVTGASGRLITGSAESAPGKPRIEIIPRSGIASLKLEPGILIADADRIPHPLKIRRWQPGDWMVPFGMHGRKKVSDIFTDLHVPVTEKTDALVVELDGSRVAALIGWRIDDSVKVTDATVRVLRITLE